MTTFHNFMDQGYNQQFLKSSGYIERLKFQKKFEENLPKINDKGNQSTTKFLKGVQLRGRLRCDTWMNANHTKMKCLENAQWDTEKIYSNFEKKLVNLSAMSTISMRKQDLMGRPSYPNNQFWELFLWYQLSNHDNQILLQPSRRRLKE